jgi:two-component system, OmpR family, alkaline phosphatase synthesis response regulator PhoP
MVKVLLVEDEELLRGLYSKVLRDHEYEVEIAIHGEDALIKVNTFKPDLIILDIALPRLDGIGVLKILKEDPELKKNPCHYVYEFPRIK